MKRAKQLALVLVPSLLAGGLLFGSTSGADNRRDPWGHAAPTPPTPPTPPTSPLPSPHHRHGGIGGPGVSIRINGNQVQIDGIDALVEHQLRQVRHMIASNPNIPRDVRDRLNARMDKVRATVHKRLRNVKTSDLDQLESELEKMGEELETAMEGLEEELEQLGDRMSKDMARDMAKSFKFKQGKLKLDFDSRHDDDDDDDDDADDRDDDDDDLPGVDLDDDRVSVDTLKNFSITKAQRDQIRQLRATSDAQISVHRKQLDEASVRLETALADPKTSDADISRYVDQISQHEAAIRKARLLTWVSARRMLDADQVRKIEDAARKQSK